MKQKSYSEDLIKVYELLGINCYYQRCYEESVMYFEKELEFTKTVLGEFSFANIKVLFNLAILYKQLWSINKSKDLASYALDIAIEVLGNSDELTIRIREFIKNIK